MLGIVGFVIDDQSVKPCRSAKDRRIRSHLFAVAPMNPKLFVVAATVRSTQARVVQKQVTRLHYIVTRENSDKNI
jgi:hypothetical protein